MILKDKQKILSIDEYQAYKDLQRVCTPFVVVDNGILIIHIQSIIPKIKLTNHLSQWLETNNLIAYEDQGLIRVFTYKRKLTIPEKAELYLPKNQIKYFLQLPIKDITLKYVEFDSYTIMKNPNIEIYKFIKGYFQIKFLGLGFYYVNLRTIWLR